jgi:toxin-antitoxin system PIN domain toxin
MRGLLDVNVLIALLDADHSLHTRATAWFDDNARSGGASCPPTQNGCIRVMSHPVVERLREATAQTLHEFWADDLSLLDPRMADSSRIHGPRQLTDVYLLALAVRRRGRFVTFDESVPSEAVFGFKRSNLLLL